MTAPQQNVVFIIRPYKLSELSEIYQVSRDTMRDWIKPLIKEIGKRHGHYYNSNQVEAIYKRIGPPKKPVLSED